MPGQKDALLTLQVKRYLQRCVDKSGKKPELLPSEMELAGRFGVSRVTVRRAVKELIEKKFVMRLSKRCGLFTNPEKAKGMEHIIGIVGGERQSIFYDKFTAMILSGFIEEMEEVLCQFELLSLPELTRDPEQNAQTIRNMGVDALFWMIPSPEDIGIVNKLIKERYPIVTVNSPFFSEYQEPDSNCIGFDFAQKGKAWAEFFLKRNLLHPIYCGGTAERISAFQKTLTEHGVPCPDDRIVSFEKKPEEAIKLCLKKNPETDGIAVDGTLYSLVIDFLRMNPRYAALPVLLDGDDRARHFVRECPDLNLNVLDPPNYYKTAVKTGRMGAKMLQDSFKNGGLRLKKKLIKWF